MAKRNAIHDTLHLVDGELAELRMRAINTAACLPEDSIGGDRLGKSATKVVDDAAKIMAFVLKRK